MVEVITNYANMALENAEFVLNEAWVLIHLTWLEGDGIKTDVGFLPFSYMLIATVLVAILIPTLWLFWLRHVSFADMPTLFGGAVEGREEEPVDIDEALRKESVKPGEEENPNASPMKVSPMKVSHTPVKEEKKSAKARRSSRSKTPVGMKKSPKKSSSSPKKSTAMKK